jgi:cellulose synthase/poly-beta-1,6-N-acetylglucosamine synthase-like glycosyltransferase
VVTLSDSAIQILVAFEWFVLVYFVFVNAGYLMLIISALREVRENSASEWDEPESKIVGSALAPRVSILAPAYNEEATVTESVRALLTLSYPNLEVVLVNDGSTDGTLDTLKSAFSLHPIHNIFRRQIETQPTHGLFRSKEFPSLVVVDKSNGGKADALNAGLNLCSGELVCAIDADTLIEPDALLRMVRPFLRSDDIVAGGGTIRVANGSRVYAGRVVEARAPRHPLAGFQVIEYLRAFLFGRLGWNRKGGNLIISGAFGLFRRDAMIGVGGYLHDTVGEDMELVARLRTKGLEEGGPHKVEFVPDPVAWTEVPQSMRMLGRQRDRWHRGLADVVWRYRRLFFNPRYGSLGLVVYPYFVLIELIAPVIEALGLLMLPIGIWTGAFDIEFALLFLLVAYGLGLILTVATLLLEEWTFHRYQEPVDLLILIAWTILETFGYRQLTLIWRLRGLIKYLRGRKEWGVMARKGFADPDAVEPETAGVGIAGETAVASVGEHN